MEEHPGPPAKAGQERLPVVAWTVVAVVAAAIAAAWFVTWRSEADLATLLHVQLGGTSPADAVLFLLLSGVMMFAMMMPSALPMARTLHGLETRDGGSRRAWERTGAFVAGYVIVWTAFTALSLLFLMGNGLLHGQVGWARYVPGVLLVAAGGYQFTGWKRFCLRHCRTPFSFLMTHWRPGVAGAGTMGLAHGGYCLGCCWLLMLVLFVAGTMSILWMGVFAALVLVEKTWSRGVAFSRVTGVVGVAVGVAVLVAAGA